MRRRSYPIIIADRLWAWPLLFAPRSKCKAPRELCDKRFREKKMQHGDIATPIVHGYISTLFKIEVALRPWTLLNFTSSWLMVLEDSCVQIWDLLVDVQHLLYAIDPAASMVRNGARFSLMQIPSLCPIEGVRRWFLMVWDDQVWCYFRLLGGEDGFNYLE